MSYILFLSIMLFITPFFAPELFNVDQEQINEINEEFAELPIFQVVLSFINQVVTRFVVLVSISTSGTLVGTIVGIFIFAYSFGFLWALLSLIAEALP